MITYEEFKEVYKEIDKETIIKEFYKCFVKNNKNKKQKWRNIEEYLKGDYDWVLVKFYDNTGYEYVPHVMEFNKADGNWHYNDKDYTELEDVFEIKYFVDMQEIEKNDK